MHSQVAPLSQIDTSQALSHILTMVKSNKLKSKASKKSKPAKNSKPSKILKKTDNKPEPRTRSQSIVSVSEKKEKLKNTPRENLTRACKSRNIESIDLNNNSNEQTSQNLNIDLKAKLKSLIVVRNLFVKSSDFKIDSIVLAKQKYSIAWPAKIVRIEKQRVFVYFFGDKRCGYVQKDEIYDFISSIYGIKSQISSKNTPKSYSTGIAEVEILLGISSSGSSFFNKQ